MPKANYIQSNDDAFLAQQITFRNAIPAHAAVLGVTDPQIAAQAADVAYFDYVLQCQKVMQNGAQQWTAWKDLTRNGGTPPPAGAPGAPTLPAAVAPVVPGIEARFRLLVKQIKASANYNESIGEALGIEGPQRTGPDLTSIQPKFEAVIKGNRVELNWGWGGNAAYLDICEIQVDRGDGQKS